MLSLRRHFPRLAYFLAGLVLAGSCFLLTFNWYALANGWLGLGVIYDTRPLWLVGLMELFEWLPWIAIGAVVLLRIRRGPKVKPLAFALGAATPYLALLGSLILGPPIEAMYHQKPFQSAAWIASQGSETDWPDRLQMVDDLIGSGRLRGLARDSVQVLLGPPEKNSYWPDQDLVYWLGPERGLFRIDSEWLGIRFGRDGLVRSTELLHD